MPVHDEDEKLDLSTSQLPSTAAVVGAGTMGAGIAQLAASAGMTTYLYDPVPEALERGSATIESGLKRLIDRGRITVEAASAAQARIRLTSDLSEIADAQIVIEAAPERLDLKKQIMTSLAGVVSNTCVLATNTSSLSVTEIAANVPEPARVVGLHFFNPAPVMRLVELVAGEASAPGTLAIARAVGEAMQKHVIDAADIPGFVVNRCNRPYSLEALRLLESGIATTDAIDRVARLAGRFRMGPFELMDLIGLDTNHAVAEAFYLQSFGEPRFQPSPLQARKIAAGQLGRKTGAGWYDYSEGATWREPDPEPEAVHRGGDGKTVVVTGGIPVAEELRGRLRENGFTVSKEPQSEVWLTLNCDPLTAVRSSPGPTAVLLAPRSLHQSDPTAVGFHIVPPVSEIKLVEVTSTSLTGEVAYDRLLELITVIGCVPEHVGDAPGLILGRIVCQLINEAAFLIGNRTAAAADIDAGLELGVNHPRGPVAWARQIGLLHVVSVLDGLYRELGEERYRVAPLLRQHLALGSDDIASH